LQDFTQVDNNVTRHLPSELQKSDWNALIMHYLGLDHIGHKTGPQGPAMLPKQREMDDIVRILFEAVQTVDHLKNTLVVLVGDHGMNAGGNHGGSGPGETEPALVFASPKFTGRTTRSCPTLPKDGTEFEFYRKVQQSDVVPTIASLLGFPVPKNSLGVVLEEVAGNLLGETAWVRSLRRNAKQVLVILEASMGRERWLAAVDRHTHKSVDCQSLADDEDEMACLWVVADTSRGGSEEQQALSNFLYKAQDALSSTASSYDVPRMVIGIAVASASLLLAVISFPNIWPPNLAGSAITIMTLLYCIMMFATSYVEEEQHFWYWITPAWFAILAARSLQQGHRLPSFNGWNSPSAPLVVPLLACHRLMVRWNQTGQKHAGEADIVHAFFPSHHVMMWLLVLATYLVVGMQLARTSFSGSIIGEGDLALAFVMILPAVIFKLNFTQADAPELVLGLGEQLRGVSANIDLVTQARVVFVMLTLALIIIAIGWKWNDRKSNANGTYSMVKSPSITEADIATDPTITLADRLHVLLTLFLITQTRAPNIPLFLFLEVQRRCFSQILPAPTSTARSNSLTLAIAFTSLLLSQTTYFAFGGSNSISSIDLGNAYNGVANYNIAAVGVLLFASNWAGAVWWCSAAVTLLLPRPHIELPAPTKASTATSDNTKNKSRAWVELERAKLHAEALATATPPNALLPPSSESKLSPADSYTTDSWTLHTTATTAFTAASLVAVMAACTLLRTHLFIWTVFSPKYLYAMAWAVGWHLFVSVGLGRVLWWAGGVV
jgi:ethanolaminephosphotransferase